MNNLFLLREELRENGERLAYQFLDGLNWKQYTYLDIINSIDYLTYFIINNNIFNNKVYNTGKYFTNICFFERRLINKY